MFFHNFKYAIITILKNKSLVFWSMAFPIILGILFNMAFSEIENTDNFKPINIAVIQTEYLKQDEIYQSILNELSSAPAENKIFNIRYTTEEEANNLLKKKEITGYIIKDNTSKVVINNNGINETILSNVISEIDQKIFLNRRIKI